MPVIRDQLNWIKLYFIPGYLLIAGVILYWQGGAIFEENAYNSLADMPRWLGCVAFSYMGFCLLIASSIQTHSGDMGFPWSYLWKYPFLCPLYATLVFAACQMFDQTKGYLFIFMGYPLAFLLGYLSEIMLPLLLSKARDYMESK